MPPGLAGLVIRSGSPAIWVPPRHPSRWLTAGSKSKVTSQAAGKGPIKRRATPGSPPLPVLVLFGGPCALTAARASLQTEAALRKRSPKQGASACRSRGPCPRIRPCRKSCAARRGGAHGASGPTGRTRRWRNPPPLRRLSLHGVM